MSGYRIISSDNHVFEPPDLWTSRAEPKFRDRAPHIVTEADGDWWYVDNVKWIGMGAGAQPGVRFEDQGKLTRTTGFENVLPGAYIPEEHVKDLDADGVDVGLVYPTLGLNLFKLPDSELLTALLRTYNDWLAEFCKPFPSRLKGIALLNIDDVGQGVRDLELYANLRLAGAVIPVYPPEGRSYDLPDYEPLWAAAQDLDMPLSLHIDTNRAARGADLANLGNSRPRPTFQMNADHWVRMSLGDMIMGGVFEHYPKLQVGSVEHELSWATHFLDRLDYTYTQRTRRDDWHRFQEDMLPSDYFHRNVFLGFTEDGLGIRDRHIIGVDNLQWGSDYPHQEGTFPRSQQILEEILADCTEEEKAKIAGGNAARVYHLD